MAQPIESSDVRVLVAEDSPTMRRHLVNLINSAPGLRVIGEARDGEQVVTLVDKLRPDVVSMDIRMPLTDGLEATRRIMNQTPTPVVVVSGLVDREIDLSFQALQAGALAVVEKPLDRSDPGYAAKHRHLINTLVAMARVRVIRRWETRREVVEAGAVVSVPDLSAPLPVDAAEIVAIGASAGGPSALSVLLHALPSDYRLPIVIAQHMPDEFTAGLARWLEKATSLHVQVADDNLILEPGGIYLAPGAAHLTITRWQNKLLARLVRDRGDYRYRPSVDLLFESVVEACGAASVGVVLTGMGDDGAAGLLALRQAGAMTLAQDEASCTVFGMPGAAIACGAVVEVLSLSNLAVTLAQLN
ncbi:MAG: chemotaxis response regulator protein-glutamate methylesterase [Anaerolineaceae bacterium]|nr:chemotaxis response regulator protein-glutamate methylesterase [Anaerolineaceae bacterium]